MWTYNERYYSAGYRINAYSWGSIRVLGTQKRQETGCKDNKLRLYFIKEITMRTKTWEEISKDQLYDSESKYLLC